MDEGKEVRDIVRGHAGVSLPSDLSSAVGMPAAPLVNFTPNALSTARMPAARSSASFVRPWSQHAQDSPAEPSEPSWIYMTRADDASWKSRARQSEFMASEGDL